ncbi:hypothetical protein [Nocardia sp. NPDC050435]|uniref:hypothetical protein n=1 Tax=Nocardia sp. NPDC050435 TaxID=3155040 RepID=UPI0033C14107
MSIDAAALVREVRAVANEHPRHVYDGYTEDGRKRCVYTRNGAPSCLIGHAALRLGVSLDQLRDWDGRTLTGIEDVLAAEGVDRESSEVQWLDHVQFEQDHRRSWGEAVRFVDELFRTWNRGA